MKNAKADASLYLLTGLLQRLEISTPGLVEEMRKGVRADREQVSPDTQDYEYITQIFDKAELLLNRIQALKSSEE